MEIRLDGRAAVVGGSSSGLGYAAARALAGAGARVLLCARTADDLERAAAALRQETGADVAGIAGDLTDVHDVERIADGALERFDTVDILVNNAGGPPGGRFSDLKEEDWRRAVDLTLMSAVELTRRLLPGMRDQGWGRIVNVTSTSVKQPIAGLMLSNSIRAAVVGWAKTLANEVGSDGVLVNSVCPGYTATDRLAELAAESAERQGIDEEEVWEGWEELSPLGRVAEPQEIASVILFLASEEASYVTGAAVPVDGGRQQCLT